jgi:type VI secretion system protein ImpC
VFAFQEKDGLLDMQCPTEINISDRRANEINKLGFIPLIHWKRTNNAAFISGDTVNRPKKYNKNIATENAQASAWLPHMLAVGRFSHFLKVMGRSWLGRSLEPSDIEREMTAWIKQYVCEMKEPSESQKAELPLKDAYVEVRNVGGEYGHYSAQVFMNPWTPLRQLTANMSMVTEIPNPKSSG